MAMSERRNNNGHVALDRMAGMSAAQELQRRELARNNTLEFVRYTKPNYRAGAIHIKLASKLDDVLAGRCRRLMVMTPPRHGKSELVSRKFPALYLGHHPEHEVITATYGSELSLDFGRDVRNLVDSNRYHALFPNVLLAQDSKAKNRWHTQAGGSYLAAGVDTPITGYGANCLVIDDPIKNRADAESPAIRQRAWDWYRAVAYTRLMPKAAIIITMTRWHEDDPCGHILEQMKIGGDQFEIVNFPACDENGEIIEVWPEAFPKADLQQIQTTLGGPNSRDWISLYGQRPAPPSGALFKTENITILDAAPEGEAVRGWDFAATAETGTENAAYTVGLKLIKLSTGRFVVAHVLRFRGLPDKVEEAIVNTAQQDGSGVKINLPQDPGQAGKAQVSNLTAKLIGYSVEASPESGDKVTRASPIIAQCNVGNLSLVRGPWNEEFLSELQNFPNGRFKDQVDALSRASLAFLAPTDVQLYEKLGSMGIGQGFDTIYADTSSPFYR